MAEAGIRRRILCDLGQFTAALLAGLLITFTVHHIGGTSLGGMILPVFWPIIFLALYVNFPVTAVATALLLPAISLLIVGALSPLRVSMLTVQTLFVSAAFLLVRGFNRLSWAMVPVIVIAERALFYFLDMLFVDHEVGAAARAALHGLPGSILMLVAGYLTLSFKRFSGVENE
jgi:hypothetical protein